MNDTARTILVLLSRPDQHLTQTQIAKRLKLSKQLTRYHLISLVKKNFVKIIFLGKFSNYELTYAGKKWLSKNFSLGTTGGVKKLVRLHGLTFKFRITRAPKDWVFNRPSFSDIDRTVKLRNWVRQIEGRFSGYWFQVSPSYVRLKLKDIYGVRPEDCILESVDTALSFASIMCKENKGLVLGEPDGGEIEVESQEFAFMGDEFAKISTKLSGGNPCIIRPRFKIDFSKGSPEIDFTCNLRAGEDSENYADLVELVIDGDVSAEKLKRLCAGESIITESRPQGKPVTWAAIARLYRAVDNITDYYAH